MNREYVAVFHTSQLEEVCAEIERLQANQRSEWLPIETAPKDGTEVLVFSPDVYYPVEIVTWQKNPYNGDAWASARCVDGLTISGRPTHWMPLPPPPPDDTK